MSKYRPATLPKGNSESTESSAVPAVRTRAEIRAEWEARQNESASSSAPSEEAGGGTEAPVPSPAAEPVSHGQSHQPVTPPVSASDELPVPSAATKVPEAELDGVSHGPLHLVGEEEGLVHLPANRDDGGFVPMPAFSIPASDDPRERLDHYARGVVAAEYAARANAQRVNQQKIIVQGQNLLAMKQERLWEVLGLPDFDALVKHRFNYGKNYANKLIRTMPVVRALESVTSMELAEKHLRPLVPVHERHGDEAVRETWDEALRKGKITEKSLKEAAYFLGFGEPIEQDGASGGSERKSAPSAASARVKSVEVAFGEIRSLMQTDSEQAKKEALALKTLAEQLCAELGIEDAGSAGA